MEIHDDAGRAAIGPPRIRTLLAVLLASANQLVSIDRLVDELWPDAPPPDSRALIHSYVSRLRRALGPGGRLVTRRPGYLLSVGERELDADRYRALVVTARTEAPADRAALLREAEGLWHGPAFADVPHTPAIAAAAAGLTELRLTAAEERFAALLAGHPTNTAANTADDVAELTALAAAHPLRERFAELLMRALHRAGRTADALAAYQRITGHLRDELGVDPGPALRAAHQTVLAATPEPGVRPKPESRRTRVPCQLPPDPPRLIGRETAFAAGRAVLASGAPRLAVTGPGGVGKTTFALAVAAGAREAFPDGVLVTARGDEPVDESMLTRFLGAFGIPAGLLPAHPRDRAAVFWDLLGERRVLIVLDDVPDETHVRPLLPVARGCGLVVTSRRRLAGLDSFHALPLDVLPVDAGVTLLRATAGARQVDQYAGSIVEVCGGLPLAIKVAGARLSARPNWTVRDLARRLADTRSRLDWLQLGDLGVRTSLVESVSGLTGEQQVLLRRLGLLDAAEFAGWVTAALLDEDQWTAERVLDDLVEAHLVEPAGHGVTGPRYRMHDLVRLVAGELADDVDAAALTRSRHGWLALAAAADDRLAHWFGVDPAPAPAWRPPDDAVAAVAAAPMRWFGEEHDALTAAVRQDADAVTWALAQRLSTYLELCGRYDDWRAVVRAGLDAADACRDRQGQATMLSLMTHVEACRDEYQSSVRYGALTLSAYQALDAAAPPFDDAPAEVSPALAAARRAGDALAVGFEAGQLVQAARLDGARIDYLALFEEARDAFRVGGVPLLELWALKNAGLVYARRRRFAEGHECMRRAREIFAAGLGATTAGGDLAGIAVACGRVDLAERLASAAIEYATRNDDPWTEARALHSLGDIRAGRGDPAAAATYREALAAWRELRMPHRAAQVEEALARLA